jgi:hypothetical protein
MLEQGLVVLLLANTRVSALVGARIYPVQGPPANPVYPYITYQDIPAESTDYTFDPGVVMDTRRIQFTYWGLMACDGANIMIAQRNALSGFTGTLADADATRVIFAKHGTFLNNFDVDSRSYRSVDEYEFQISEP